MALLIPKKKQVGCFFIKNHMPFGQGPSCLLFELTAAEAKFAL